jgi:hypothetical protein
MHDAYPSVLQINDHSNLLLSKLMDTSNWELCASLLCERKKVYDCVINDRSETNQTVFENVSNDRNPYTVKIELNHTNVQMAYRMIDLCLKEMNVSGSHAIGPFNAAYNVASAYSFYSAKDEISRIRKRSSIAKFLRYIQIHT